jgi:hypothetical protein
MELYGELVMEKTIPLSGVHWIPGVLQQFAQPIIPLPQDLKVDFLIDERQRQWNEELVQACYSEDTAKAILKIPLSHNMCEDFVAWENTTEGIFTVKSAYMLAKSKKFHLFSSTNGKGGTSNIQQVTSDWKRIWKIHAPEKMKIVLWRLAHDCLPTGQQLLCRHICNTDACCFCGQVEMVAHAIVKCQYVAEIWREMKKWCGINCKLMPFISPQQWLWEFLANASDEEATIFTLIIWHIWDNRNGVRNGENFVHPIRIVEKNKSIYSSCNALR